MDNKKEFTFKINGVEKSYSDVVRLDKALQRVDNTLSSPILSDFKSM